MCVCFSACPEDQDVKAVVFCVWRRGDLRWFPPKQTCDRQVRSVSALSDRPQYRRTRAVVTMGALERDRTYPIRTKVSDYDTQAVTGQVLQEEDRRIRRARLTEPPVFLESALGLTVEDRVAIEEAEAAEGARPHLEKESVSCLWLCSFISSFLTVTSFEGVLQSLDAWRSCMWNELRFECRTLNYTRCQVNTKFSVLLFGVFNISLCIS